MVLHGRSVQEYSVSAGVLKVPFLALHFSCYTLMMTFLMISVLLLSMLMILFSTKCNQSSYFSQQLELTSELESDLQDTVSFGRK